MLSRSSFSLLAASSRLCRSRRAASSDSGGGSSAGLGRTAGLARFAAGSVAILVSAAAVNGFGDVGDGPTAVDEAAAVRRAFRRYGVAAHDAGGKNNDDEGLRLVRVSQARLQELVATGRVDEVHVCPADSALYALDKGRRRCYAVRAGQQPQQQQQQHRDPASNSPAEQLAAELVAFRDRLAAADARQGRAAPTLPLLVTWCPGPVLGDGGGVNGSHYPSLSSSASALTSAATAACSAALTPGTAVCLAAWAAVCLRRRLLYLAAPLAALVAVPVLILRDLP